MKPADILKIQRVQLAALAESWLQAGAASFELWSEGALLASWPPDPMPHPDLLAAPLVVAGEVLAEVRVSGIGGAAARARLASEAALIAQQAQLETELEAMTSELITTQDQLLAMYDLTQNTRQKLDMDDLLCSLVRESTRLVHAAGGLMLLDLPEQQWRECNHGGLEEATRQTLLEMIQRSQGELLLCCTNPADDLPPGIDNLFFVPISIGQRGTAGLCLYNKPDGFSSPAMKLTRAIAEQAGARIENLLLFQDSLARARMQTEMDMARRVQVRLLPRCVPQIDGLEIAASSQPALNVGGDFYDFIAHPQRPFVFTIGDVSGKGMPAALMMSVSQHKLRSLARLLEHPSPEIILKHATEDMYDDFTEVGMFATLFLGQYDPAEQVLAYANAGHAPVIYRPRDGAARLLEADGTPIGVLPQSLCGYHALQAQAGDVLVAATDGLGEVHNASREMFGYERLLELVDRLHHASAQQIAASILEAVHAFSAQNNPIQTLEDDQTIVVIKITGRANSAASKTKGKE
jgi:sigma-B regulation protein RsbU (phosphoserine phosphatase)